MKSEFSERLCEGEAELEKSAKRANSVGHPGGGPGSRDGDQSFAFGIANAICERILTLMDQTSPASGLLKTNYFKKIYSSATVQF